LSSIPDDAFAEDCRIAAILPIGLTGLLAMIGRLERGRLSSQSTVGPVIKLSGKRDHGLYPRDFPEVP
jgi:hypothetical protein